MSENKIKISAETIIEFEEIEKAIKELPRSVKSRITTAEMGGCGIHCTFEYNGSIDQIIYLPKYTQKISDFGDKIGIYADRFFFIITGEAYKQCRFTYSFID